MTPDEQFEEDNWGQDIDDDYYDDYWHAQFDDDHNPYDGNYSEE